MPAFTDAYPADLLLTPGTVIQKPLPVSGFVLDFYTSLEVLEGRGTTWLVLARGELGEAHVYRLRLRGGSLYAEKIVVA